MLASTGESRREMKIEMGPGTLRCRTGALALSGRLTCANAMGGGVRHRVGLHLRIALQQRLDRVHDAGILIALVALSILFIVPEAEGKLPITSILRVQSNQVDKPRLLLQDRKHLVA